jgi:membrane protein
MPSRASCLRKLTVSLALMRPKQIQDMIKNLEMTGKSTFSVIIGVVTLIVGATTVFGEIQESINIIWQVKPKPKAVWLKLLKDRLWSGSMVITLGFLLLVSLILNGALLALSDSLKVFLPAITVFIFNLINLGVSFLVITVLFAVIFKVLPDAKMRWKEVRPGAIFTAVLFMVGWLVIGIYISKSGTSSTYGAAGSLIVILLWVYYTAVILYFGAEFTRAYVDFYGVRIEPAEFAVHVEQKEETHNVEVVPPKHGIGKSK